MTGRSNAWRRRLPLKVYGALVVTATPVHGRGQRRVIVATRSRTEAARLVGVSASYMATYGGQTWNATEIERAMSAPGTPFVFDGESVGRDEPDRYLRARLVKSSLVVETPA